MHSKLTEKCHRLPPRVWIAGVCLLAIGMRLGLACRYASAPSRWNLWLDAADRVIAGKGLWTLDERIVSLHPLEFLPQAGVRYLFGTGYWPMAMISSFVPALTALLVIRIGTRMVGFRPACLAAAVYALDPYAARQELLLYQSLFVFVVTACIATTVEVRENPTWARILLLGFLLGIGYLVRSSIAVYGLFIGVRLLFEAKGVRRGLLRLLVLYSLMLTLIFPWALRNYYVLGRWETGRADLSRNTWVTHCEFRDKIHPYFTFDSLFQVGEADPVIGPALKMERGANEYVKACDVLRERAIAYIVSHPGDTLRAAIADFVLFFSPVILPYYEGYAGVTYSLAGGLVVDRSQSHPRPTLELLGFGIPRVVAVSGIILLIVMLLRRRREFRPLAILLDPVLAFAVGYSVMNHYSKNIIPTLPVSYLIAIGAGAVAIRARKHQMPTESVGIKKTLGADPVLADPRTST